MRSDLVTRWLLFLGGPRSSRVGQSFGLIFNKPGERADYQVAAEACLGKAPESKRCAAGLMGQQKGLKLPSVTVQVHASG